jgi:hypothetical protein
MAYTGCIHWHFTKYGINTIFYFTAYEGTLVSVLNNCSQLTREEVCNRLWSSTKTMIDTFKTIPLQKYGMYERQKYNYSSAYILASTSLTLLAQVLTKSGTNYDNGPIFWKCVMSLVKPFSCRERHKATPQDLKEWKQMSDYTSVWLTAVG